MSSKIQHPPKTTMSPPGRFADHSPRLLPVCCVCRFVRDDTHRGNQQRWMPAEDFVQTYSLAPIALVFTHTYCPDCLEEVRRRIREAPVSPRQSVSSS